MIHAWAKIMIDHIANATPTMRLNFILMFFGTGNRF